MKTKFILIAISSIYFFSSCNSDLSRSKAETLLREQYPDANTVYVRRAGEEIKDESKLDYSIKNNLIVFAFGWFLGENGKKYIYSNQKPDYAVAYCNEFNEITGIKMLSDKSAEVEYTVKVKGVTPIGEIYGIKVGDIKNLTAKFNLYDDGWRVDFKRLNPEQYTYFNKEGEFVN